jgi:hypothetical protein
VKPASVRPLVQLQEPTAATRRDIRRVVLELLARRALVETGMLTATEGNDEPPGLCNVEQRGTMAA